MKFTVTEGVHDEVVDDGHLILRPGATDVLHLTGADAEAFELACDGTDVVPSHLQTAMAGLVELDVVRAAGWSRRRVLQMGGAAAAATVAVIALPSVAAAASTPGDDGGTGATTGSITVTLNFYDGTRQRPGLPQAIPENTYQAALYSDSAGTPPAVATAPLSGASGQNFLSFTFSGITAGSYHVDIVEPFTTVANTLLDNIASGYDFDWNLPYAYSENTPHGAPNDTAWPRYQAVTVTAGDTSNLELDIQVRVVSEP